MVAMLFASASSCVPKAASDGTCAIARSPRPLYSRKSLTMLRRYVSSITASPNHAFRDRLQLQVGRAFVDLPDLGVAKQFFDRIVLHETVAAVEVDRQRRDTFGDFRREQLRHRRFREESLASVAQAGGVVDE